MSVNKRYSGKFTARNNGQDIPAEIIIMTTGGDSTSVVIEELKFESDPVRLTWEEIELYDCIQSGQMEVSLIAEHDGQYREIYEHDGKTYGVLLLDGKIWWSGVYARETWSEPFSRGSNYIVSLTFSDFNYLSRIEFDSSVFAERANLPLRDLLVYGCKLFNQAITGDSLLDSVGYSPTSLVELGNVNDTPMLDCVINVRFLDGRTWKEVLELVFGSICCRLKQYNGRILVHIPMGKDAASLSTVRDSLKPAGADAELSAADVLRKISLEFDNERSHVLGTDDFSGYAAEDIIVQSTSPGYPAIGPAYEIGKIGSYGAYETMDREKYDYREAVELGTALVMQTPSMTEQMVQSRNLAVYGRDKSYSQIDKDDDICHPILDVSINNTYSGGVVGLSLYISFEVWYQYDMNYTRLDLENSTRFRQIKFYIAYTYDGGARQVVSKTVEYTPQSSATDEEREINDMFFNGRGNAEETPGYATVEIEVQPPQSMNNHIALIELIPFVEWRDIAPTPQWVAINGLIFRNFKVEIKSRDVSNFEVLKNARERVISFRDGNEYSKTYEISAPADSSAAAQGVITANAVLNDKGDEYLDRIVEMLRMNYGDSASRQRWIITGSYRYDHVSSPLALFTAQSAVLSSMQDVAGFIVRSELWHVRSGICSLSIEEYIPCELSHVTRSAVAVPSSLDFGGNGGTKSVKIYSNVNWVAVSRNGVFTLKGNSGNGCGILEVTAPVRPSGSVVPVRYIDLYYKGDMRTVILSISVMQ